MKEPFVVVQLFISILWVQFSFSGMLSPTVDSLSGFPAISGDGKSVAAISIDHWDYEDRSSTKLLVLNVEKGNLEKRFELFIDKKRKNTKENTKIMSAAQKFIEERRFRSTTPVTIKRSASNHVVATVGQYVVKYTAERVSVEISGKNVSSRQIPKGSKSGACCGDLENPQKKCSVAPSLHGLWYSKEDSVLIVGHSISTSRDGCEGTDEFTTIRIPVKTN